jgi:hypothetical protein
MKITDASFLTASFKTNKKKIRQYLYDENIVYIRINNNLKVNTANFLANFSTYIILTHE